MKKILLGVLTAAAMVASTAHAFSVADSRAYVGADYQVLTNLDNETAGLAKGTSGVLGVVAGLQVNEYVGVELGWGRTVQDASRFDEVELQAYHTTLGVTGQYPITDNLYAKGFVGASWIELELDVEGLKVTAKDDGFLGKVGVGYQINENSVVEATYNRESSLNAFGVQYKYLF